MSVVIRLPWVGLAIVDEDPCEVLYLSLQKLELAHETSAAAQQRTLGVTLDHIQIDSPLRSTRFPVLLCALRTKTKEARRSRRAAARGSAAAVDQQAVADALEAQSHNGGNGHGDGNDGDAQEPCLRLSLLQNLVSNDVVYIQRLYVELQPIAVQLEQNLAARLLRLASLLQEDAGGVADTVQHIFGSLHGLIDHSVHPSGGGADGAVESERPMEIYIKELTLQPISLVITAQLDPLCADAELQEFHPANALPGGQAAHLLSLRDFQLSLGQLRLSDVFESPDSLGVICVWHYLKQLAPLLHSASSLITSLDLFGSYTVVQEVSASLKPYLEMPLEQLMRNPLAFTGGLALGAGAGVLGGVARAVSGVSGGVGSAFSALTFDAQYVHQRRVMMRREASTTRHGLSLGLSALGAGVVGGVSGIVTQPIGASREGLRKYGKAGAVGGFVVGTGQALVGVVAKPTAGLAACSSKVAEGIANHIKAANSHRRPHGRAPTQDRARQPRSLEPGGVLLPYPPEPSL